MGKDIGTNHSGSAVANGKNLVIKVVFSVAAGGLVVNPTVVERERLQTTNVNDGSYLHE